MESLIQTILAFSYLGIFLVVFAETGLLIGLVLPGDSLLITAGIFAAAGKLSLPGVMLAVVAGAILGCVAGYYLGKRFGPAVFKREQSLFFKPEYVAQSEKFFQQYGWQAVVLARFVPIVRTIVPTLAGVSHMPIGVFTLYNVLGALLWGVGLPALAYYFGKLIPDLDKYILLIVAVVLVLSILPIVYKLVRSRRSNPG